MQQINYLKQQFTESIHNSFANLKDKASADILNFELSNLYRNKLYGPSAEILQHHTMGLAEDMDKIFNEYCSKCLQSIDEMLDQISFDSELWEFESIKRGVYDD